MGAKMGSRCQTELYHIDEQVKSLLKKLTDATPSERYDVQRAFKRIANHLVECIDALNEGDMTLLSTEKPPGIARGQRVLSRLSRYYGANVGSHRLRVDQRIGVSRFDPAVSMIAPTR